MKKAIIAGAVLAAVSLTGCGHNINVQGFGLATPYMAIGYGSFSCVKDNVTVENVEEVSPDGKSMKHTNTFKVGEQITGADVDAIKARSSGGNTAVKEAGAGKDTPTAENPSKTPENGK